MVGTLLDDTPAEAQAIKFGTARQLCHQSFCQPYRTAIRRVRGGDDNRAIAEMRDAVGIPDAGPCELCEIRKSAGMGIVEFDRQDTERLAAFRRQ